MDIIVSLQKKKKKMDIIVGIFFIGTLVPYKAKGIKEIKKME